MLNYKATLTDPDTATSTSTVWCSSFELQGQEPLSSEISLSDARIGIRGNSGDRTRVITLVRLSFTTKLYSRRDGKTRTFNLMVNGHLLCPIELHLKNYLFIKYLLPNTEFWFIKNGNLSLHWNTGFAILF